MPKKPAEQRSLGPNLHKCYEVRREITGPVLRFIVFDRVPVDFYFYLSKISRKYCTLFIKGNITPLFLF